MVPGLPPSGVRKVLLLNASNPGEVRVAVLEDGELAEIFVERKSQRQITGNVYKARVVNVEPSLQAAFVDLGSARNGFLHGSDCIPPDGGFAEILARGTAPAHRPPPPGPAAAAGASPPVAPAATAPRSVPQAGSGVALAGVAAPGEPSAGPPAGAPVEKHKRRNRGRRGGRRHRKDRGGRARVSKPSAPLDITAGGDGEDETTGPAADAEAPLPAPPVGAPEAPAAEAPFLALPEEAQPGGLPAPGSDFAAEAADAGAQAGGNAVEPEGVEPAGPDEPAKAGPRERHGRGDRGGRSGRGGYERRLLLQEMLHKGQEILVQVAKEGLGQKGPAVTTYLSIPGRFLVLMPAVQRLGVSKRIGDEDQRRELKDILNGLQIPEGMGVIVRTAGMGRKREELQRDLDYLLHVWETLKKKAQVAHAPALLYEEGDVITRVFRDVFSEDVAEVIVDDGVVLERARAYLQEMCPGAERRLQLYTGAAPLFHKYGVEPQIQRLFHRKVDLKGGGSIVIEQTEALVAIDVNTGRSRERRNQDETILATNLEAAQEVTRQLRLRDIAGLVMIDFIDMDNLDHRRQVEAELRRCLARDKARLNVLPISPLGIVEMTRQRVRRSLRKTFFEPCPVCNATGHLKSAESLGLEVLREMRHVLADGHIQRLKVTLNPRVAFEIINQFRDQWVRFEQAHGVRIDVNGDANLPPSQWQLWTAKGSGEWSLKKTSEVDEYVRNN